MRKVVSDEEILSLLRALPLLERTADNLARRLSLSASRVRQRLYLLEAAGKVRRAWDHSPVIWEAVE